MSGPPASPPSSSSGPSPPSPSASQSHSQHSHSHSHTPHSPAAETLHAPTHAAHAHYATHPIFAPHSRVAPAAPPAIPEKCLSWCSQRDGAPAMCRMLCLRRRPALPTQSEALARLRPPAAAADGGAESGAPSQGIGSITEFFDAWRARCAPYSFIYVKGTPEGVVGRYMEEMDADDGQYDFGPVSRHAPHKIRRKSEGNVEYFDWGEAGYLLHVPLTSMLGPLLNLPHNIQRVFAPTTKLANRYYESFENGTQARSLSRFTEEVYKLGALDMAGRVVEHWSKRWEKAEADAAAAAREATSASASASARQAPDSVKEKNTKE